MIKWNVQLFAMKNKFKCRKRTCAYNYAGVIFVHTAIPAKRKKIMHFSPIVPMPIRVSFGHIFIRTLPTVVFSHWTRELIIVREYVKVVRNNVRVQAERREGGGGRCEVFENLKNVKTKIITIRPRNTGLNETFDEYPPPPVDCI